MTERHLKAILTCAFPQPGYELPHRVLEAAGLVVAARSPAEGITPTVLHDRIIAADRLTGLEDLACSHIEQRMPDKPWRNLATDIFLCNLDVEAWGWVDFRIIYLLDFWKSFDPTISFVLAYDSPAVTLGGALEGHTVGEDEIAGILGIWQDFNTELLRFYYANQERCLLVNSGAVRQSPQSFSKHVAKAFGLPLLPERAGLTAPPSTPTDALLREYLAQDLVRERDESRTLYEELESAADFPLVLPLTSASHAWNDYAKVVSTHATILKSQSERLEALGLERSSLASRLAELEQVVRALTQARDEQATQAAEREAQLAAANAASTATASELARVTQEGETTLLQLHQVQEELEQHWLDRQRQQQELATLEQDKSVLSLRSAELEQRVQSLAQAQHEQAALVDSLTKTKGDLERLVQSLTQSKDEQARLATEREARLAEANFASTANTTELARVKQESELTLLQLHQLQEELEQHWLERQKQRQELESLERVKSTLSSRCAELEQSAQTLTQARQEQIAQVDSLTKTKGDLERLVQSLTQSRDEQERLATERGVQLAAAQSVGVSPAAANLEKIQAQHDALAKENELLLLQLHQVQEELESYYVENQKLLARGDPQPLPRVAIAESLPAEILYDLRREIDGDNWYYAEHDGRWAGPEACSTLRVPAMAPGSYLLEVCVVDAMEPEIVSGMVLTLNGRPLATDVEPGNRYSKLVRADITVDETDVELVWEFAFRFPKLVSPAERGSDDQRRLAIRVASLCVKLQDQLAPWLERRKPVPWWAIWKRVS